MEPRAARTGEIEGGIHAADARATGIPEPVAWRLSGGMVLMLKK